MMMLKFWDMQQAAGGPEGEFEGWGKVLWLEDPVSRRRMFVGMLVSFVQICCGVVGVALYSSLFLKEAMGAKAAFLGTVLMGLVKVLVCVVVVVILEKTGRRPLLVWSCAGCCLGAFWISGAFAYSWGPTLLIGGFMVFMASHSIGLGPVFFAYVAEIFPTKIRGKAFGLCLGISRLGAVLGALLYPVLSELLGVAGLFLAQAVLNLVFTALLWVFVRETQGRSLEEMEAVFKDASDGVRGGGSDRSAVG